MRGRLWPPHENELDARFSFPDRRHSFYSEVYPGVRVPSCLIFCPSSLPILRSVSRSVSCFPPFSANCLSVDECWAVSPATKYRALQPLRLSRHNTIPRTSASSSLTQVCDLIDRLQITSRPHKSAMVLGAAETQRSARSSNHNIGQ